MYLLCSYVNEFQNRVYCLICFSWTKSVCRTLSGPCYTGKEPCMYKSQRTFICQFRRIERTSFIYLFSSEFNRFQTDLITFIFGKAFSVLW